MFRFRRVYEFEDLPNYQKLLSADFSFHFSATADSVLAARYGANWSKEDEIASAKHLFEGVTQQAGSLPAAAKIELSFPGARYEPDPTHADSSAWYVHVVVDSAAALVEVWSGNTESRTTYLTEGRQDFYLVRGDAAVLDTTLAPRADRWYIRRWDDLATAPAIRPPPIDSTTHETTLGAIKARYR
jgi:hypothetical protein